MPRHMVQDAHALLTELLSTSTSMRRWPSILVIGSIVIRFDISPYLHRDFYQFRLIPGRVLPSSGFETKTFSPCFLRPLLFHRAPKRIWRRQYWQHFHQEDEDRNPSRHEPDRDQELDYAGEINGAGLGLKCGGGRIEAVQHPANHG